jgi:hypothetical protein
MILNFDFSTVEKTDCNGVLVLRSRGLSAQRIAERVGCSARLVEEIVRAEVERLQKTGRSGSAAAMRDGRRVRGYEPPGGRPQAATLPTRIPSAKFDSNAERDAAICQLRKNGVPLDTIGRLVGLSAERVRQVASRYPRASTVGKKVRSQ